LIAKDLWGLLDPNNNLKNALWLNLSK